MDTPTRYSASPTPEPEPVHRPTSMRTDPDRERDGFLGIAHVPFNHRLRTAREARGWTRRRLAIEAGVQESGVGSFEALKAWPSPRTAARIADALQDDPGYLFPPEAELALRGAVARTVVSVLPVECLTLADPEAMRMLAPVPDELEGEERNAAVEDALDDISGRQRYVIERRFGLRGHQAMTLAALAESLGTTPERVRQIEGTGLAALRKSALRTPPRNDLKDFR